MLELEKVEQTKDKLKEKHWLSACFGMHVYVPEQDGKISQDYSVGCCSARERCQEKQGWQVKQSIARAFSSWV